MIRDGFTRATTLLLLISRSSIALSNVQSYAFFVTVDNRSNLLCSVRLLGDDFQIYTEHRLSAKHRLSGEQ